MRKLTHTKNNQILSTRDVADLLGTVEWKVRRLFENGSLEEPIRFAGKRVIHKGQLPDIIEAMRSRGWLGKSGSPELPLDCPSRPNCTKKQEAGDE